MNLQKYYIPQFSFTDNKEEGEKRREKKREKIHTDCIARERGWYISSTKQDINPPKAV